MFCSSKGRPDRSECFAHQKVVPNLSRVSKETRDVIDQITPQKLARVSLCKIRLPCAFLPEGNRPGSSFQGSSH